MQDVTIGLAFFAGFLSFVSPCVLPLVPAYVGYMGGRATHNVALEAANKAKGDLSGGVVMRANMLIHGLAFVLGFTFVFVAIGLMTTAFIGYVGSTVNVLTEVIGRLGGVIIILFGLHFMGALRRFFTHVKKSPNLFLGIFPATIVMLVLVGGIILWAFIVPILSLPIFVGYLLLLALGGAFTDAEEFWMKAINSFEVLLYSDTRQDIGDRSKGGLSGSFIMGVVFSAGWTPCIGPLLGTILTVAAQTGDVTQAVPMLTAYSLGLGIPFILTAVLMEGAQAILRRLQRYLGKIEFVSGTLLLIIGIMVASGNIQNLSANLATQQADLSFRIEECGLGFARGNLTFNQAQDCIGGSLYPVALGQSASGELSAERTGVAYLIELDETVVVAVELSRVESTFPVQVVITDNAGNELASSDELRPIDDTSYLVIQGVELRQGRYIVTVTQDSTEDVTFRLKIREFEPDEEASLQEIDNISNFTDIDGTAVGLDIGNRAPDFTIMTVTGEELTLSELRGQVVLLNFWGTWCGPCRREMPEFQDVYTAHENEGFTILALAVHGDTEANVIQFRDEFGLTFILAVDERDRINDMYSIVSQPSTLLLNQDGVIVYRNFGITVASQIEEVLQTVLAQ